MKKRILRGILCAALAAGCGGEEGPNGEGATPDSGSPQDGAPDSGAQDAGTPDADTTDASQENGTIVLLSVSPTNGIAVRNNNEADDGVTVQVEATEIELVDPETHVDPRSGEGHYHVYLDSNTGEDDIAVGFVTALEVPIPLTTATGIHRIHVELHDNTHHRINPGGGGVSSELYLTVAK